MAKYVHKPDYEKPEAQEFAKCQVPWTGGLSGSIVERLLYMIELDRSRVTYRMILTLASALVITGAHSLSEMIPVVKAVLQASVMDPGPFAEVDSPLDLENGCVR